MLIGYARISKSDGSQNLDLQIDALLQEGISFNNIYQDESSGKNTKRLGLDACLKALRENDTLIIWKLDRLGRSLQHLVNTVQKLTDKKIHLKVITCFIQI